MRVDTPDRSEARREKPLQRFREGVRYARNDRLVLGLILVVAGTELLLLPFVHGLMPVYASEVFHVGPAGLGLLMAVVGIGSVIGTIMIACHRRHTLEGEGHRRRSGADYRRAVAFSRVSAMPLAVPFLMLLSGSFTTLFTVNSASIQSIVPERLRGRVSSVGTMIAGLFPLGSLLAGGLAELFGAPTATLAAGAMLLLFSAGLLLKFRQLWSFGR